MVTGNLVSDEARLLASLQIDGLADVAHNVSMKRQGLHPGDKPRILEQFRPAGDLLYESLDMATSVTRDYFDGHATDGEHAYEVFTGASLTRYWVCRYLQERGQSASFDQLWLPNNGVALRAGVLDIRCLKSRDGRPPRPGSSRAKRAFYNQAIMDELFFEVDAGAAEVNLLVTWTTDANGVLVRMDVHSPAFATSDRVTTYWSDPLLSPVESFMPEPEPEYEDEIESEDLPGYDVDDLADETETSAG